MPNPKYQPVDAAAVPRFADIATFMRTKRAEIDPEIDIGLVGVPFDIGLNYRGGPREAPSAVRQASRLIRRVNPTTGIDPYELCNVADIGDASVNPLDFSKSISQIEAFFAELVKAGIRPVSIGGDHTIPTPILRALAKKDAVGILQIDSHADTLDEMMGTKINHATFMRRGLEEGLIDPKRSVQLGLRGSRFSKNDVQNSLDMGLNVITMDDYDAMGRAAAIATVRQVLGKGPVYVTIDIDGIDPSYCPGTAVPEIGGIIPRDAQVLLRSLSGADVIGGDICEVAPCYDPTGVTSVTAANFMFEITCLIAEAVHRRG